MKIEFEGKTLNVPEGKRVYEIFKSELEKKE